MTVSFELKPCPFCGGKAGLGGKIATESKRQNDDKDGYAYRFINCITCMASTDQLLADQNQYTAAEAVERWNKRT